MEYSTIRIAGHPDQELNKQLMEGWAVVSMCWTGQLATPHSVEPIIQYLLIRHTGEVISEPEKKPEPMAIKG